MPPTAEVVAAAAHTAHPVLEHSELGLPPVLIASVWAWAVLVAALALPPRRTQRADRPPVTAFEGDLTRAEVATRSVAVILLLVAVVAGRVGADDELENLAPALVVGVGWPLLFVATAVLGPVWRWCDPWDAMARPFSDREPATGDSGVDQGSVWAAAVVAVGWMWFFSASPDTLDPRWIGAILAGYTAVTVAGCLAFGRRAWLSRAEPLGIVLSWLALLPRGRLVEWCPPRGGEALLGVLVGGIAFGGLRRTQQWTSLDPATGSPAAWAYGLLGLLGSCLLATALLLVARRVAARVDAAPAVARAMVPAVAGIVVATALARNRLTTSIQLLPGLAGDPFGLGWDLFGPALDGGLDPAPLGTSGLLVAQLAVLVVAHLAGAVAMGRGLDRAARVPAVLVLVASMTVATVAVPLH